EPDNHIGMVQAYEAPGVESAVRGMYQMMGNTGNSSERPRIYEHLAQSFYNMQPFLYVHALAKAFGLRGFCTSVHNACASAAFAIDTAARQIQSNHADVMVVVGGEAFDTAVRLEWFRTLSLYAADHRMRPFDGDPSGFYVGEGGIAFILESFEHAAARNADIYATYGGSEFRHQAWKQTLPDLRSQRLAGCVTSALEKQGLGPDAVDLVLPHAACTSLSDSYESQAVQSALGKETDAVAAAYKPHVGHMLAASGLMELAAGLLAMKNGTVPGTLHSQPERTVGTIPLAVSTMDKDVQVLLKLSTGFTGHDGASIYRRFTGLS
ncbi:MAG: beta-ketoacyl synthase N-terminal-like domain-containing protein, partial [Phycisphaerae bacterium]